MKSSLLVVLHSAVTSCALLLFISLFCPLSHVMCSSASCVPTASCSPPDLAVLRSLAAAFPPPLFTGWQRAASHNICACGNWGPLTINCSFCFTPMPNNVSHKHMQSGGGGVGRVTELQIDLVSHYVEGISPVGIPDSLCSLSALTSLRLVGNGGSLISGPIPDCVGNNLTQLVHLDVSRNSLTGSIPLTLSGLQSLQFLDVSANSLSGALPPLIFSHLANLAHLDLSDNAFSGPIPSPLNLTHLISLSLHWNALSGPLPTLNTPKLVSLDFSSNHISGSLSPLFQASNLTSLLYMSIPDNQLNGVIPNFDPFHFSPLLSQIDLYSNLLSGSLPQSICGFTNLSDLDLSYNELSGQMNTQLGMCNFTKLESLALSTNLFTGPFPDRLGSLSNLGLLSIDHNSLSGSLPNSWQNLTSLYFLALSGNSLLVPSTENPGGPKLPWWLFALSHLQNLYLSAMQLQTTDLVGMCSATGGVSLQLAVLDLSNNLFNAGILQCFSIVTVFQPLPSGGRIIIGSEGVQPVLNLSGNPLQLDLSYNPNAVKLLPKSLSTLDLSTCMLRGHLTKLFFQRLAPSLYALYLAHNQLEGQIPGELGNMSGFEHTVDLSYNFFTGLSPLTNGRVVAFDRLSLSNNNLTGNLLSLLSRIVPNMSSDGYLGDLDLSHNLLSGDIPPFLFQCLSNYSTWRLKLNHNRLQGSLPNVPFPPSLEALSLSNNQLSGQIPQSSLINLTELAFLDLSHNKLEGNLGNMALFSSKQQLTQLRVLLLGNNHFTGTIPTSLGDVAPALHIIDFSNNYLTGPVPVQALQSLPAFKLSYFPVAGFRPDSNLEVEEGTIYEEIAINTKGRAEPYSVVLQALTALDLSSNKLSGPISVGLGELSGLRYLNIARNKLSGPIPSDLGRLGGQLESLDMSFNEFVGPIPSSLQNLTNLAVFNVSYNEGLSGPILQTPQFENKDSYIGNLKLCSSSQFPILPYVCPNPLQHGNATTSSQDEPHKSMNFVKKWINEWIAIPGLLLGIVVGFLGTLWAIQAFKW